MHSYALKTDYRYRIHKLSVGKGSLKLHIKHSKRNNSKKKHKFNGHFINNENNFQNSKLNSKSNNLNSSFLNNNRNILKDQSKENRNPKNINNARGKLLSINSINCDLINFKNYLTNNDYSNNIKIKSEEEVNKSENFSSLSKNINGSYIHITLINNNPTSNSKKTTSVERKQNITVNKLGLNNNNIYNSINNNSIKEKNGINGIKKRKKEI